MQASQPKSYMTMIILIASGVFAASIAASVMLPFAKVSFEKAENFYVIYYGHLVGRDGEMTEQTSRILAARPDLVVVPHSFPDGELNLTPAVHGQFEASGIKVLTYVWTNYGQRNLDEVRADIDRQMASGVDGVFIDEVTNLTTRGEYDYYSAIYRHVKGYGQGSIVVMNPGHYAVEERVTQISDIVSLEEEWVYHDRMPWITRYPPAEFMGVSSNEYCDQCVTGENAAGKTAQAWDSGIGYHYSTDMYIDLPAWFGGYAESLNAEKEGEES